MSYSEQHLARELARLTDWTAHVPNTWERVLAAQTGAQSASGLATPAPARWRAWLRMALVGSVGVAAVLVLLSITSPTLSRARALRLSHGPQAPAAALASRVETPASTSPPIPIGGGLHAAGETTGRQVIQTATVTLAADDVRATFLQVGMLLREVLGEYTENSHFLGSGTSASANLTLRVRAERLPEVLNALRELGSVVDERIEGLDVTDQVIDLAARIRNTRRVEAELIKLLDVRPNSPLTDVLRVQAEIDRVREQIERLDAQQSRLTNEVRLAKVHVIVRPETPAPVTWKLGERLASRLADAWRTGLYWLVDSVAVVVQVAVGGLIWWVVLASLVAVVVCRRRRGGTRVEREPS